MSVPDRQEFSLHPIGIMDIKLNPKIVTVQKARDGVLIEFDDGNAALYPISVLAAVFHQAVKLEELDSGDTNSPDSA